MSDPDCVDIHYVIISSGFNGDPTRATFEIRKKVLACPSVSFVTPETLLYILELHLMARALQLRLKTYSCKVES
jgi:hypothetical protein